MSRSLLVLVAVGGVAYGQPYPGTAEEPPRPLAYPVDAGAQPGPGDPGWDTDPDIDGYDAEYDVYYDNVAAQGYDDGYNPNAYSYFESTLSPYGTWVDDGT